MALPGSPAFALREGGDIVPVEALGTCMGFSPVGILSLWMRSAAFVPDQVLSRKASTGAGFRATHADFLSGGGLRRAALQEGHPGFFL
jgi:hypothetical protein